MTVQKRTQTETKLNQAQTDLLAVLESKNKGQYEEALILGLSALKKLGIVIKKNPGLFSILREVNRTKSLFNIRRIHRIPSKTKSPSPKTLMQLKLLTELIEPAMKINEDLWYVLLMWLARLSMKKGGSPYAVIGYAGFAMVSIKYLEDVEQAEELYQVTLKLLQSKDDHSTSAIAKYILGAYVSHIFAPWSESIQLLAEGAEDAFNAEEKVIGGYCLSYAIEMTFAAGQSLSEVGRWIDKAKSYDLTESGPEVLEVLKLYESFIDCMQDTECRGFAAGSLSEPIDASLHIPVHLSAVMLRMVMAYNYDDYEDVLHNMNTVKKEIKHLKVHFVAGLFYLYEGLALTALAPRETKGAYSTSKNRVNQLKALFEFWVKRNPFNYGQPYKMIAACSALFAGDFDAGEKYLEQAIDLADEDGAVQYKAMDYTLISRHCRQFGKLHMAKYYVYESAGLFNDWQGKAVNHHILSREEFDIDYDQVAQRWRTIEDETYTSEANEAYKLVERLKGKEESLLTSYCEIISESLTSEKVLLFMDCRGILHLKSKLGVSEALESPCESIGDISVKVVNQVFKSNQCILVNSDKDHDLAKYDAYILDHGQGSILALPMAYDGTVIGVLYVESEVDILQKTCDAAQRLTDHVTWLLVNEMESKEAAKDYLLFDEESAVLQTVKTGHSIKESAEITGLSQVKVMELLLGLYEKLKVDNMYDMRTR